MIDIVSASASDYIGRVCLSGISMGQRHERKVKGSSHELLNVNE